MDYRYEQENKRPMARSRGPQPRIHNGPGSTDVITAAPPAPRPYLILSLVLSCYLLLVLDTNVVSTALPLIQKSMGLSAITLTWVQNAYMLCFAGFLLVASRAGEIFGQRRVLQAGVMLFTVASMVIGFSQGPEALIAARAAQGIGASIIAPTVLAIIIATFAEGEPRARAMGWYSVVAGAGASAGLIMGGILASLFSWRLGFFMNLPVGLFAFFAIGRIIPPQARVERRSLDLPGAGLSTAGMILLVFGIVRSAEAGWGDDFVLASIISGLLLLAVFVVVEKGTIDPIVPLRLFADRSRNIALVARMMFIGSMIPFFFFTTQLMQDVMGFTPIQAGLGFLPMSIATFVSALALPRPLSRFGARTTIIGAHGFLCLGLSWLGLARAGASYWSDLAGAMTIIGLGNGAIIGPLTTTAMARATERDRAAVSGIVNVAHQLGSALGLAVLIVLFSAVSVPDTTPNEVLSVRVGATNIGGAGMNALAMLLCAFFLCPRSEPVPREQAIS